MPQGPPEPPPTIVIGSFAGVRNNVSEERLKQDDLAAAVNVDIDDAGQLRRRRGYSLKSADVHHSLTTLGDVTLVVRNGMLGQLYPDYSFTPIVEVGPQALCYAHVGDVRFYSSPITSGKIVDGQNLPWGEAIDGQWVSPVTRPGPTLGQVGGRLLGGVPNASVMETYKGRIYLAHGSLIWATELYLYNLVDRTRNFIQLEDDVTLIASVSDGLYVGTAEQLLFLQGTFTAGLKITEVLSEGVIPGSLTRVPYSKAMPQARSGPVPEGYGPMFMTTTGVVLGLDGGQAYNLTQDRVVFPTMVRSAAVYREDQGLNSYLMTGDSAGGPTTNARIGDYVDAEIVRASQTGPRTSPLDLIGNIVDTLGLSDVMVVEINPAAAPGEGFGWADYSDLDAPTPLYLPANVATQVIRNLAPSTANNNLKNEFKNHVFWDGTKVIPRALDDVLVISFEMQIAPATIGGILTFSLETSTLNIAPANHVFAGSVGEIETLRIDVRIAVRASFLADGGKVFLKPTVPCMLYEFSPEFYPESEA